MMRMGIAAALVCAALTMPAALAAQDAESGEAGSTRDAFEAPDIYVDTPSGGAREVMDTPDSVTVLDRRAIEERLSGQTPELLDGVTGVFVQHTAQGQGSPFLRGLTGKQVLVLVNGVRFNNSTFRFGPNQYLSSIDPDAIERIEIVRGPSSVLYGSDAQGGVINIITRRPKLEDFNYSFGARGRFASANMAKRGGIFGEVGSTHVGGLVSGSWSDVENLVGGASIGRQPFTAYEEWGGYGSVGAIWGAHRFDFTYSHFQQNDLNRTDKVSPLVANPENLKTPGQGDELQRLFEFQIDDMMIGRWTWEVGGMLEQVYVDLSYHKQQESVLRTKRGSNPTQRDMNYNVHTLGMNAQAVMDFASWARVTAGVELYHDIVHSRRWDTVVSTDKFTNKDDSAEYPDWASYTSFGAYLQDEAWFFDDRLLIRGGVRYSAFRALADVDIGSSSLDGVNELYHDVTGALALAWRPAEEVNVSLSLARGFRAPNLDDLAGSKGTGRGDQIPNPDLDPERQWSADLGAKFLIPTCDPNAAAPYCLSASANVYFNYFDNWVTSVPTTFGGEDVVQLRNDGRAVIWGFEAEVSAYLVGGLALFGLPTDHVFFEGDALGFRANLSWTRGDDLENDEPVNRIPPLMSEISIRYEAMRGEIYIEPFVTIVGRQDQYSSAARGDVRFVKGDTPSYVLFGLRAGWYPVEHFKMNLGIHNIGNRSYHPLGSGTFGSGTNVVLSAELRW